MEKVYLTDLPNFVNSVYINFYINQASLTIGYTNARFTCRHSSLMGMSNGVKWGKQAQPRWSTVRGRGEKRGREADEFYKRSFWLS